ncbi:helix-turn-helix domain-containing protein [Paraburkholderia sp. C35]|uniref:helix-turn-helix domain-containing protein n=1 Tax=Paraburkholderia sp. C35 TaxID=2126993 RepID=UPI000D68C537|nr:helix-turn-helix domain-containing protein [Paraburkholderia sp. C35]
MPDQLSRMSSLRDVASQILTDTDVESLLHSLLEQACRHGPWDLGAIMSVDVAHGDALVIARRDPSLLSGNQRLEDRWELATSPALVALQRNEPVYIRDARETTEFLGYRREAQVRGYRTVVVLPMACRDLENRPMVMSVSARRIVDVAPDDLVFMGMIVHLGAIAIDRAHQQQAQLSASTQLRRVLGVQSAMLEEVLAGGAMETLIEMLADLLDVPVLVIDFDGGAIFSSRSPDASLYDADTWQKVLDGAMGMRIRETARELATRRGQRRLTLEIAPGNKLTANVEPLLVDGEVVGALLSFGDSSPDDLQMLAIENARFAVSVQLMRSVIRFRAETRTLTELFFEIVERRWRGEQDVLERARRLGLSLTARNHILVIDYPNCNRAVGDRSAECHRISAMLAAQHKLPIHTITVGGGLVCLLPGDAIPDEMGGDAPVTAFGRRLCSALGTLFGREPILVVGDTFSGLEALAKEWERCWRMIRIARGMGKSGALSVPDLGPLPMLIGAADSPDVRAFMSGTIGPLIAYDRDHRTPYMETLSAYIRHGCRSQACADAMGLHVTTLRYRLARISELFGIDVETPERRFAVELALQLHKLVENRLPEEQAAHSQV